MGDTRSVWLLAFGSQLKAQSSNASFEGVGPVGDFHSKRFLYLCFVEHGVRRSCHGAGELITMTRLHIAMSGER